MHDTNVLLIIVLYIIKIIIPRFLKYHYKEISFFHITEEN